VVSDLARSAAFLETLGFRPVRADARWIEFDGSTMSLTITLDVPAVSDAPAAPAAPPAAPATTGRVMLAIELETGPEVDALWAELRGSGLADSGPPRVYEWGSRSVYFVDGDGYIWEIYAWVETPR
jgi:catechol 2,3-dioxygenase-like lactoylglutathione lyase family enzyme